MPGPFMAALSLGHHLEFATHRPRHVHVNDLFDLGERTRPTASSSGAQDDVGDQPERPDEPSAGVLDTDGEGNLCRTSLLIDYVFRSCHDPTPENPTLKHNRNSVYTAVRKQNLVQFARETRKAAMTKAVALSGCSQPFKSHPQSRGKAFVLYQRENQRVFRFTGRKIPSEGDMLEGSERYAMFVLLCFKPFAFVSAKEDQWPAELREQFLADRRGGGETLTWTEALARWTLPMRRRIDPAWYGDADGSLRHPYLDNVWRMYDGEKQPVCVHCQVERWFGPAVTGWGLWPRLVF